MAHPLDGLASHLSNSAIADAMGALFMREKIVHFRTWDGDSQPALTGMIV